VKIEIELPEKYATKLEAVEDVEPTIREQIEIQVLPQVLQLVTDAHRQLEQQSEEDILVETGDDAGE